MKKLNHYAIALLMQRPATNNTPDLHCMLYCIWEKNEAAAIKEAEAMARLELLGINKSGFEVMLRNTILINHKRPTV